MAQKAELEHKFNDLDEVRGQVKKLRDELFVARRLEWMREGIDTATQHKGAELLMHTPPARRAAPAALRLERRGRFRRLGSRHPAADQFAAGDQFARSH